MSVGLAQTRPIIFTTDNKRYQLLTSKDIVFATDNKRYQLLTSKDIVFATDNKRYQLLTSKELFYACIDVSGTISLVTTYNYYYTGHDLNSCLCSFLCQ